MKTIEIDLDTLNKLKNLKIRPDESLSYVVGRLAVYGHDWEPLTEEFKKELEESSDSEYIKIENLDEYFNSLCDEDIEEDGEDEDEIEMYVRYPHEFIDEVDKLMAQEPIDLPAGMSLTEYLKSLPEADDKLIIELNESTVELLDGLKILDESLDSTVKRIAGIGIIGEEILTYGSIREIQRLLREGKSVGSFKTVEEFNEHLKYLPKERIVV
jgi:predicted CopG family antitoxin